MRPISLLSTMALCLATASAGIFTSEQQPMREDTLVRTTPNWGYTNCGPLGDPVDITSIEVVPDSPQPGQELTIKVDGIVRETVEEGAYAEVIVRLGLIKVLSKQFDLCEEARKANASVQCPIEPGSYHVEHTVPLPNEIPRAKFLVSIEGYTAKDDYLVCLKLNINFRLS